MPIVSPAMPSRVICESGGGGVDPRVAWYAPADSARSITAPLQLTASAIVNATRYAAWRPERVTPQASHAGHAAATSGHVAAAAAKRQATLAGRVRVSPRPHRRVRRGSRG